MKKLISVMLISVCMSNMALADCDFKTDIKSNADGSYTYSKECHVKVGEIKRDLEISKEQIVEYKKAIELKDLALVKTEERAQMWMNTSFKLEERLMKIDELQTTNKLLYTGLGIVGTVLAVWAAGQLR